MKNLVVAIAILFFGGWQPVWNSPPKDTAQLALNQNLINGSQSSVTSFDAGIDSQNNKAAESEIGDYFVSANGFGILVNDQYYGGQILNRFFNSTILSWFAFFTALSVCGIRIFFFFLI